MQVQGLPGAPHTNPIPLIHGMGFVVCALRRIVARAYAGSLDVDLYAVRQPSLSRQGWYFALLCGSFLIALC